MILYTSAGMVFYNNNKELMVLKVFSHASYHSDILNQNCLKISIELSALSTVTKLEFGYYWKKYILSCIAFCNLIS